MKNTKKESQSNFDLMSIVDLVAPTFESVREEISELKKSFPFKNNFELAEIYGNRLRSKYTSVGVASALPGVIPGFGTSVQIALEAGSISADLGLMLRWMAASCYRIGLIYGKNIKSEFSQEFIKILGIWCGVIKVAKEFSSKFIIKTAVLQFDKKVSGKILTKINKTVGFTLFTKYGSKRGGIALGKLIPFGIGAAISGAFNFNTMNGFKKAAIEYFGDDCNIAFSKDEN